MKREIFLTAQKATPELFAFLESKKLVKLITPTQKAVNTKTKTGAVSKFYTSKEKFGTHTLMCVGKRSTVARLSSHDDNEDFILINPLNLKFRKLFLVLALDKGTKFLKKFYSGKLSQKDLLAIELEFNNPRLSFFTMLKKSFHCEVAENKSGQHPVFFVTEPSKLKDNKLPLKYYNISVKN
ncbi:hypothetical protein [Endomicrobium proavitum]|uniref:Uncharacterized protein n=1 Tax=Endomicrobium proavitum TaxID=1408281 RepID=A0A0G3WKX2_9BACT|nr:hypothetical protein [Endomicrobium proavitum]AKL98525.1 hypothetical protein Epro_1146 [Endomicrobium proavitum]